MILFSWISEIATYLLLSGGDLIEKLKEIWLNYRNQCLIGLAIVIALVAYLGWQTKHQEPVVSNHMVVAKEDHQKDSRRPKRICVDVKGAVNRPGIYYLSRDSRVQEAIEAAGGQNAKADLRTVNLAKQLQDQQMIYIPVQGEQAIPTDATAGGANEGGSEKVNINTANKDELQKLDGVGEKKAEKIIEYRQQHGEFKSADDLKNVNGFGDKTVAKLKDQLSV